MVEPSPYYSVCSGPTLEGKSISPAVFTLCVTDLCLCSKQCCYSRPNTHTHTFTHTLFRNVSKLAELQHCNNHAWIVYVEASFPAMACHFLLISHTEMNLSPKIQTSSTATAHTQTNKTNKGSYRQ